VEEAPLTVRSDMLAIVRAMARPDSGLEVRDRLWLKIVIPNAFIGSDVVDWLHNRVQGLDERRDARKLASQLLRSGYIRHTVNKYTFSEQCYYVFGDLCIGKSVSFNGIDGTKLFIHLVVFIFNRRVITTLDRRGNFRDR